MGDCCNLTMRIRAEDRAKVCAENWLGEPSWESKNDDGTLTLEWEEVNFGATQDRDGLARAGVPFVGEHGSGCAYCAFVFASDGTEMAECESLGDGVPACDAELHNGFVRIVGSQAEAALRYFQTRERAEVALIQKAPVAAP